MLNDEPDDDDQPTEAVLREIEFSKMRAEEEAAAEATNKATTRAVLRIYGIVAIIIAVVMLFTGQPWWIILMIAPLWPLFLVLGQFAGMG